MFLFINRGGVANIPDTMISDLPIYDAYVAARAIACPACPVCVCASDDTPPVRDNYVGVRLYFNEHSSYSYSHGDNHHIYKDNGLGFGTTVGNNLTDFLRVEYETLYMGAQYTKSDTDFEYDIWANMLNAYLMWPVWCPVTPYVGAGVGLTGIWGEIEGELSNAFGLSYQVLAGALFELNSRISLDIGVKYAYFGDVDHTRGATRVYATQIYVGATYNFGM